MSIFNKYPGDFWASQVPQWVKNPPAKQEGSTLGLGRSPEGGHGNPLHCSCLENPVDRGAGRATIYNVAESHMTEATYARTHDQ